MITLTFGSLSVQLRNPDFGDKESVEVRRVSRKTRGGDIILYRDPAWPKYVTYEWKWSFLFERDLQNLLHFMRQSLGQVISVTDYEGRVMSAIITTPAGEVSQEGVEDYRASLSFQMDL